MPRLVAVLFLSLLFLPSSLFSSEELPPAATSQIDFTKHIQPLLTKNCASCHTQGKHRGGLSLETRADLLEGGESGPAIVVGKSEESLLIRMVAGLEEGRQMPQKGPPLTKAEVGLLRAWIDQGAAWPKEISFGFPRAPLSLKKPAVPAGEEAHPVDRFLRGYSDRNHTPTLLAADDATWVRRVSLDLTGLPPTPRLIEEFLADTRPDKAARLIDQLLADKQAYADHWLTFWNDHLRNAYRGTGFIDGGRKTITPWLHQALYDNLPYDQFVRQLVNPTPASEGFIKGFVWRGVVNASQSTPIQAAQNVAQVFLATNLKCASCHDSFVNHWKLKDAYALANVFADEPLEIHRCDKATGKKAGTGFIYPELGNVDEKLTKKERLRQLADLITRQENGRFARTIVNRLWATLIGRGLVEPLDDLDQPAWYPELLDWLAADFIEHGHDLKHAIRRICTSRAYRAATIAATEKEENPYVFRGPLPRRLTAEQLLDSLATLTDTWPSNPAVYLFSGGSPLFDSGVIRDGSLPVDIDIQGKGLLRLVVLDGDNGQHFDWANWGEPRLAGPAGTLKLTDLKWLFARTGYGNVQLHKHVSGGPLRIGGTRIEYGLGAHAPSEIIYRIPPGYTRFRATVGPETEAVEKKTPVSIRFQVFAESDRSLRVRAVQLNDDDLSKALGRPTRDQVVTRREGQASLLQALELTNGKTLDRLLRAGAKKLVAKHPWSSAGLVDGLYRQALGREPTPAERATALELVASPPAVAGTADLLWVMVNHPEFQVIR